MLGLGTRDYNTSTETLVFNQTVTSHTIEVPLIDDDIFELNEVFIGNLVSVSDDARVTIDPDMADINIVDDDSKGFVTHYRSNGAVGSSGRDESPIEALVRKTTLGDETRPTLMIRLLYFSIKITP